MRQDFDRMIQQALEERASSIEPSRQMLENVKKEAKQRKEHETMKKIGMKKMVAAVAAVCALSVTCYAASQLGGVRASSKMDIHTPQELEESVEGLDFDVKYVEGFANGLHFAYAGLGETQGMDEEGNPMGESYQMLTIVYQAADGKEITLSAEEGNPSVDAGEEAETGYIANTYKFVPTDYEKTAEDLEKEAAGELYISYGTDEVEINKMEYYGWVDDGVYYSLVGFDCGFGEEEMEQMAEEVQAE